MGVEKVRQSPQTMPTGLTMLPRHGLARVLLYLAVLLELGSTEPLPGGRMLPHGYWLQELAPAEAEAFYVGPGRLCQLQPCQRRQSLKVNIPIQALLAIT